MWKATLQSSVSSAEPTVVCRPARSMHKREVDLEGGGAGAALLAEGGALGSSACDELAMRRSSSASPGAPLKPAVYDSMV